MRDDARRNQGDLLRAATDSLSGTLPEVLPAGTLHADIARRTGLGRSTVYRHLGDRHEVAAAVVADQFQVLHDAVQDVVADRAPVRDLLDLILTTQVTMHPLSALVLELPERDQERYVSAIVATVTPALEHAAASLRPGLRPADLRTVLAMLQAAVDEALDPLELDRMVHLLLDGLVPNRD